MRLQLFLIFALVPMFMHAQSLKTYERAGDKAFESQDYNAAVYYYNTILKLDLTNKRVEYKYAKCAVEMSAYTEAEKMLKRLSQDKSGGRNIPDFAYTYGRALQGQGKYAEAVSQFQAYLNTYPNDTLAQMALKSSQWAKDQKSDGSAQVTNPGKNLNSAFSDFAPALLQDTLYYSSYRFNRKKNAGNPPKKWTKVLTSTKLSRAKEANRVFKEQDTVHVAHTTYFPNGRFMVYTQCRDTVGQIKCDLYLSARDDRGKWLPGQKLPEGINASGYTTTHPMVAAQANGRLTLFFASDRPGGLGKLDLYQVELDSAQFCPCKMTNKKQFVLPAFGKCQPLTSINTKYSDASPFYHAPSQTLYWSSDGRIGFGGYDVYKARLDGTELENVGAPINSSYNDLYYIVQDSAGLKGWMASNRIGSLYLNTTNKACCFDLWQWQNEPSKTPTPPLTSTTPPPTDTTSKPSPPIATIPPVQREIIGKPQLPLTPKEKLRTFVGLPLYFDNDEPDKRTRRQVTSKTYETTATVYLNREEEYKEKFAEGAQNEDEKAEAQALISSFFQDEVRTGYDRLFELTELIHERLEAGERIEVMVKGFTSPRAQTDYNLNLGYRRISSVRNHFAQWNQGVLQPYLNNGSLIISQTSFGETSASVKASDRLDDEKNSIFNPIAARERRVEIVEINSR